MSEQPSRPVNQQDAGRAEHSILGELQAENQRLELRRSQLRDDIGRILDSDGWRTVSAPARAGQRLLGTLRGVVSRPLVFAKSMRYKWRNLIASRYLEAIPLRKQPFHVVSSQSEGEPDEAGVVCWMDGVEVAGTRLQAIRTHPNASATFSVILPSKPVFKTMVGLPEKDWNESAGIKFRVTANSAGGRRVVSCSEFVRPGTNAAQRRWVPLLLDLSPLAGREVQITLSATAPKGQRIDAGVAVWGRPSIVLGKTVRGMMGEFLHLFRTQGVVNGLRHLRYATWGPSGDTVTYSSWLAGHALTAEDLARLAARASDFSYQPLISILTPVYNVDPRWLNSCVRSVLGQAYPNWELCLVDDCSTRLDTTAELRNLEAWDPRIRVLWRETNGGISAATDSALAMARGDYIALLDDDDELAPEALYEVVRTLNLDANADMIYSDEDKLDEAGQLCEPSFKPDWSPDLLRSYMYTCHFSVYRRSLVQEVGGFRPGFDGSQDYDLALRVAERTENIKHIAKPLYHWRKVPGSAAVVSDAKSWAVEAARRALESHLERMNVEADVLPDFAPGLFRIRYHIRQEPLVSILIPTAGRLLFRKEGGEDLLTNCLRSIEERTEYRNYEVLLAHDGFLDPKLERFLASRPHRVLHYSAPPPFNFARKLNYMVEHASGDHIVIFNDDMEAASPEWLSALLELSQQEDVGAVGSRLVYPDGRLQHIGMVLGINGTAGHLFHGYPPGQGDSAWGGNVIRNYSAVTGAGLMMRRSLYREVGGMREEFAIDFNDTDLCLRLRERGYRIAYTPYSVCYHHEATSLQRFQDPGEVERMRALWRAWFDSDPYYNRNLTRKHLDCRWREDLSRELLLCEMEGNGQAG